MIIFVILCLLLVALTLAGVLIPLARANRERNDPQQSAQNVVIARERLAELDTALANREIDQTAYDAGREELTNSLANSIDVDAGPVRSASAAWLMVMVSAFVPLAAAGLYWQLGSPTALNPTVEQTPTQDQIVAMVDGLAKRLETDRDDARGWLMLTESYMVLGRFDEAARAARELRRVNGDSPETLLRLADAVAMAQQANLAGEPEALVLDALKQDPQNVRALWMAGMAARQRNANDEAVAFWSQLRPLIAGQPETVAEVDALLNRARADAAENDSGGAVSNNVQVNVDIAEDLKTKFAPEDTLYVYARAAEGPPMPLAVVKRAAGSFPTQITLSDAQAMAPSMTISKFDEIVVIARITKSGDAKPQPGDLQGQSNKIDQREQSEVRVIIDDVRG